MNLYLELDESDDEILISAAFTSSDGTMSGDMRIDLPPGHSYRGVPYEVFKELAPGEYTLDQIQDFANQKLKDCFAS